MSLIRQGAIPRHFSNTVAVGAGAQATPYVATVPGSKEFIVTGFRSGIVAGVNLEVFIDGQSVMPQGALDLGASGGVGVTEPLFFRVLRQRILTVVLTNTTVGLLNVPLALYVWEVDADNRVAIERNQVSVIFQKPATGIDRERGR